MKQNQVTPYLSAATFTLLALWFACLYWLLISLAQKGRLPFEMGPFDLSMDYHSVTGIALGATLRLFGPAIAAALTIGYFYGRAGLRNWLRSLVQWRMPGRLYLLVFAGSLAVSVLVVAIGYPLGLLHFEPSQIKPAKLVVFFFLMIFLDGPLGEEPGWRGLLLPEMLKRFTPLTAGLVVGVVWYLWHIPLYLADGRALHPVGYFVNVVSLSVIFTWFYLRSGGSLLMAVLLHTTTNYALFLVIKSFSLPQGIGELQVIYDAILVVLAAAVAFDLRKRRPVQLTASN